MLILLLLACDPLPEEGCCTVRCSDGHAQQIGAQPRHACDGESVFICEQRDAQVLEARFEAACTSP